MRITFKYATVILVICLLAGCFEQSQTNSALSIGLLIDKSTPGGPPSINAAELFVKKVNENGGLSVGEHRQLLRLVIEDTFNQKDKAMEAARRLIFEHKVVAVIGPNLSRTAYSASAVAESAGQLMISPGATSIEVDKGKKFVFRIACSNSTQGDLIAKFAYQELSSPNAAVLFNIGNTVKSYCG